MFCFLISLVLFFGVLPAEKPQKIFRISELTSMFMPPVNFESFSPNFEFIGYYVITAFSSDFTSVKLGFNGVPSYAALISKNPIERRPFRIDSRFSIRKDTKSNGLAFWLTPSNVFEKGNVFGRKMVDGILIAIVIKGDHPYIGINFDNDNGKFPNFHKSVKLKENIYDGNLSLRIVHERGILTVSLGRNNNFNEVFKVDNYSLPEKSYFAVSAEHSTGYSDIRLYAIRHSNIEYPSFNPFDDEKISKISWIWIVFIIGLIVLGATIFKKQVFDVNKRRN